MKRMSTAVAILVGAVASRARRLRGAGTTSHGGSASATSMAALVVLSSLAGCASGPTAKMATGSVERESQVGAEQASVIERTIGLDRDPNTAAYVEQVGQRLAAQAGRKEISYRFYVVDMTVPNAFALPGGYVYVSRGLLALLNSEDELAGVLGHEIGHVEARHAVKRSQAALATALATAPVQIAAGITGIAASAISPDLGAGIVGAGQTLTQAVLAPYGREQEREADRLGQQISARAGWDPRGLTGLLDTLGREERLAGETAPAGFLATHPSTPERVAATAAYAGTLAQGQPDPIAKDRAKFLARLDGLLIGDDPMKGTFVEERFLLPNADLRMTFPRAWEMGRIAGGIGAQSPDEAAALILQPAGIDTDPVTVARERSKSTGVDFLNGARNTPINGLPAVRRELTVVGQKDRYWLSLAWVQLGRVVWSIVGLAPGARVRDYAPTINDSIASFGAMSDSDKADITAVRLRITQARADETLESLGQRTGSLWDANQIAVANGLAADVRFAGGEQVKVSLREAFVVP